MMTNLDPSLSGRLAELQHRPEEMAPPAIGALWLPSAEELAERARRHLVMFLAPRRQGEYGTGYGTSRRASVKRKELYGFRG